MDNFRKSGTWSVFHVEDSAHGVGRPKGPGLAKVSVSVCPVLYRHAVAAMLNDVRHGHRLSYEQLGRRLGVSRGDAFKLCMGYLPLTAERLTALGELGEEVLRRVGRAAA